MGQVGVYLTPVLGPAIGFVVFKLDDVAVEAQNPFGSDRSDIALNYLNDELKGQVAPLLLKHAAGQDEARVRIPQSDIDSPVDEIGLTAEQVKNNMA